MSAAGQSKADLIAALKECVEVLALLERPAVVDPDHGAAVKALGDRIGYGALMSSASASWRENLKRGGWPSGGEFVAGPCFATVVSTLAKARAALASEPEPQPVAEEFDAEFILRRLEARRAASPHLAETAPDQEGHKP